VIEISAAVRLLYGKARQAAQPHNRQLGLNTDCRRQVKRI
jgi:hypothetical protein